MTAFLQLEECLAQKKDAGIPIQEKGIFLSMYSHMLFHHLLG